MSDCASNYWCQDWGHREAVPGGLVQLDRCQPGLEQLRPALTWNRASSDWCQVGLYSFDWCQVALLQPCLVLELKPMWSCAAVTGGTGARSTRCSCHWWQAGRCSAAMPGFTVQPDCCSCDCCQQRLVPARTGNVDCARCGRFSRTRAAVTGAMLASCSYQPSLGPGWTVLGQRRPVSTWNCSSSDRCHL